MSSFVLAMEWREGNERGDGLCREQLLQEDAILFVPAQGIQASTSLFF